MLDTGSRETAVVTVLWLDLRFIGSVAGHNNIFVFRHLNRRYKTWRRHDNLIQAITGSLKLIVSKKVEFLKSHVLEITHSRMFTFLSFLRFFSPRIKSTPFRLGFFSKSIRSVGSISWSIVVSRTESGYKILWVLAKITTLSELLSSLKLTMLLGVDNTWWKEASSCEILWLTPVSIFSTTERITFGRRFRRRYNLTRAQLSSSFSDDPSVSEAIWDSSF